jgi:hypothetical protein
VPQHRPRVLLSLVPPDRVRGPAGPRPQRVRRRWRRRDAQGRRCEHQGNVPGHHETVSIRPHEGWQGILLNCTPFPFKILCRRPCVTLIQAHDTNRGTDHRL